MNTKVQDWYTNEIVYQNIMNWIEGREICWEMPQHKYTEWANRSPVIIKNWLRVPEYHSIHASPTRAEYYDYVLDIDVPEWELSRQIEQVVLEVFAEFGVQPTLITFTSNRGFHNWFFQELFYAVALDWGHYTVTTLELFYKVATHYLRDLVAEKLRMDRNLLQKYIEVKIAKSMVRVPYCFHLGTQGVEIPITPEQVKTITKQDAQLVNIKEVQPLQLAVQEEVGLNWLDAVSDFYLKNKQAMDKLYRKPDFQKIEGLGIYAGEEIFPPCIFAQPKEGNRRVCAGFVANFLFYCNWAQEKIKEYMQKWFATLEEKGITKDGHKFAWYQVIKIVSHLNKDTLFLPSCQWLQQNALCRADDTCEKMRRKHPRYYLMEKQKRQIDGRTANTIVMQQFNNIIAIDGLFMYDGKLVGVNYIDAEDNLKNKNGWIPK